MMRSLMKNKAVNPSVRTEDVHSLGSPIVRKNGRNLNRFMINSTNLESLTMHNQRQSMNYSMIESPSPKHEEITLFPDIKSPPSQINSYLMEAKHKLTLPSFMDQKRNSSLMLRNLENTSPDRTSINQTQQQGTILESSPSEKSLHPYFSMRKSIKQEIQRRSISPAELLISVQVQQSPGKERSPPAQPKDFTFEDIISKKSRSNLQKYQNISLRSVGGGSLLNRPTLQERKNTDPLNDDDQVIFGETKYDNPFIDSRVRSSLLMRSIMDRKVKEEKYSFQQKPPPFQKCTTKGRFGVKPVLAHERVQIEKEWMKKANPQYFEFLKARDHLEQILNEKKKQRNNSLNKSSIV